MERLEGKMAPPLILLVLVILGAARLERHNVLFMIEGELKPADLLSPHWGE